MASDGADYGNVGDVGVKSLLYADDQGTPDFRALHMLHGRLYVDVQASELPDGAATAAKQDTMITALQLIDDLRHALHDVGTDELDVIVEGMVATGGEGHGLPDVFVVVAGDDGVDIHPLQLDANGYLKIIGQAGTAVIGKVRLVTAAGDEVTDETADAIKAILQANDGVDIGDVDVASCALPTGAATSANQATIDGHVDGIETLLAGGLPSALDTDSLKVKEQSPLTGFATSANQGTIESDIESVVTALAGGLPSVLDTDTLKVKEQSPITGFATETTLDEVNKRLGDETSPAVGSVNKQLGGIITALESLLRTNDLNLDGDGDLQVDVKTVPTLSVGSRAGTLVTVAYQGDLSATTWYTLLDISATGVLEFLEVSSDAEDIIVALRIDNQLIESPHRSGAAQSGYQQLNDVQNVGGATSLWKVAQYDAGNGYYFMHLKEPLAYNSAVKIQCFVWTAGDTISIVAGYRPIT